MNILHRQMQAAIEWQQLNQEIREQLAKLVEASMRRTRELNTEFLRTVAQPENMADLARLQNDHGVKLAEGMRSDIEQHGELLRKAADRASELWRRAILDISAVDAELAGNVANSTADKAKQLPIRAKAKKRSKPAPVKKAAVTAGTSSKALTKINGVGKTFAHNLNEAGITRLEQIAALDLKELDNENHPLHELKGRIKADEWIKQAKALI